MSLIHDALEKVNGAPIPAPPSFKKRKLRAPIIRLIRWYARTKNGRRKSVMAGLVLMICLGPLALFLRLFFPQQSITEAVHLPARNAEHGLAPFVLSGIVDGKEKIAIINNQPLKIGERISGALVQEIKGNKVTLEFKEKKIYLSL